MSSHRQEPVLASEFDVGDIESAITRVVGLELYQMTFPSMRGALGMAPALRRMPMFLDRLRDTFDLVVIASPPASEAPMGILLSRFVDGNILVLEAGRTRAPVAAELRNSLSASGGAVVGAVLTFLDISARRQAEEEQRKLASLVENSDDFIAIASPDRKLLYLNAGGARMIGLDSPQQALGLDLSRLHPAMAWAKLESGLPNCCRLAT